MSLATGFARAAAISFANGLGRAVRAARGARGAGRLRPASALAPVALVLALAGCGASSGGRASAPPAATAGRGTSATASRATPANAARKTLAPVAHPPSVDVTLAYRGAGVGVVGLARALADVLLPPRSSDPRLELTTDFRHWRDVTPKSVLRSCRQSCQTVFESAFFLSPRIGWVTTYNLLSAQDDLYRTTNGGASWQLQLRAHHSDNAGARGWVQFLNDRRGWVAMLEPTGPNATYWQSHNGGKTWSRIRPGTAVGRRTPPWPFCFTSARVGYSAPGSFTSVAPPGIGLEQTSDGGRGWTRRPMRLPSWYRYRPSDPAAWPTYELPTFFKHRYGVLPVLLQRGGARATLAFYTTADGGRRWQLTSTLALSIATAGLRDQPQVTVRTGPLVSIAGARTWWVADSAGASASAPYRIRITTDGGHHWLTRRSDLPADSSSLQAAGSRQAWALRTVYDHQGNAIDELEQTTDGGLRFTRARP